MAATMNGTVSSRKSYVLSVEPVNYSLTDGTNIPAPIESPPQTPAEIARPPTPGRGPLNSHPATPENAAPGAFPPTPEPESTGRIDSAAQKAHDDSFKIPVSPASATQKTSSPEAPQHRPSGVRRLLSLSSLRSSFNSSRTSLSLPRQSHDAQHSLKRPSSPSMTSSTASPRSKRPEPRQKKSGNWFKRKSGLFMTNGDTLDAVDEDQRPGTRDSKRIKESRPPPQFMPPISELGGNDTFSDGNLGWDEQLFKR